MKLSLLTFVAITLLGVGSSSRGTFDQTADESPRVLAAVAPGTYPPIARASRVEGDVIIEVQVDAAGAVVSTKMVSGHAFLQKASEDAAKQWKFAPRQEGARTQAVQLTFGFRPDVYKGAKPPYEFTTVFLPPYKVELQHHPFTIA